MLGPRSNKFPINKEVYERLVAAQGPEPCLLRSASALKHVPLRRQLVRLRGIAPRTFQVITLDTLLTELQAHLKWRVR